jgi:Rhs element Vgr protein
VSAFTITVLSDGQKIDKLYQLISLDVRREVNRIPEASVVLLDGDAAKRKFELSNAPEFEPGKKLELQAEYQGAPGSKATLFSGPIVRHRVKASAKGSYLILEARDAAVKLTAARKSAVYKDQDDAKIISAILGEAKVGEGELAATKPAHKQMVRFNATGWDFILTRAEANGLWVVADAGKVSTVDPRSASGEPKHTFDYGISEILDFELEADAGEQLGEVKSSGWDIREQKPTEPSAGKAFSLKQGNLDGQKLAGTLGGAACALSHPVPLAPEELQAWADARLMRSRMSLLRGRLSTPGIPDIALLDVMEIDGVGKRFNGKTLVTGIAQRIDALGWRTDIQFGLTARSFAREEGISEPPAAGLLPPVSGLQIGVVDKFEADPDKEYRVKVLLPGIDAKTGVVWARLAAPDAGKNRGWFFRPEEGDEVVLGFFNDDPRQAVILGGLYSSKNTPPEKFSSLEEKNLKKALVTKKGTTFGFVDDDKAQVFIETAGGAKLVIDDDKKSIALVDQNGNELTMDDKGITLKTGKDFKVDAGGNVEIKGSQVDVK